MERAPAAGRGIVSDLSGIHSVLCTPFDHEGYVDEESLDALVDRELGLGVDGLVLFGLAGEGGKLTEGERARITRRVADRIGGRLPLVAAADHQSSVGAADLARLLENAGASAIMALPPAGTRAGADALVGYYQRIEAATSLPIIVQDAPIATSVSLPPELLARIFDETERVRWVKVEAPPTAPKVAAVIGLTRGKMGVLGGLGGRYLMQELRAGAAGTMVGCAFPDAFVSIWRAWCTGAEQAAEEAWRRLVPALAFDDSIDTFIACQKTLLERAGIFRTSKMREPSIPLDARSREEWVRLVERVVIPS